ncbi:MAG: HD domain-containing protein [Negativicutes bacterium]|jgi:predicted hydrolase (HD superfamily)
MYSKEKCLETLNQFISEPHLIKHSLAVGAAMRYYAELYGEDVEYWQAVGLLHDADFEKFPDEHPRHTAELLAPLGYAEQFIADIVSHCWEWDAGRSRLQKTLAAVDEMTGFVTACALVRPDKSLENLEVKSVMKKLKDKAFARAVDRDDLRAGAALLELLVEEHIEHVRLALIKYV